MAYRPNRRNRPQSHLDALALILASLTCSLALWALTGTPEPYQDQPPCGVEGTDTWAECMTNGEPMDLTPVIEDEADTTISQERNA